MKAEGMDKKKFLVMMLAAIATAVILVMIDRGPKENAPVATPPPVSQANKLDDAQVAALKAGTCALTECRFSPVITPAFEMTSNGKTLVGIWNVARSSQTTITLKNVSPDPVTVYGVMLFMCLNEALVPLVQVPAACQYLKMSTNYQGGNMDVKPGEAVTATLDADTHGQVAKLQFDTTRGPVILLVTVQ
jgi:hypothetical protein